MLQPEQKSALHYAEVSRRFAEGTHAEVQEVGGVNSAKIWAEKAMSAAEFNGGNLLKSKGDLIVGGPNGVYQRLPVGQPSNVLSVGKSGEPEWGLGDGELKVYDVTGLDTLPGYAEGSYLPKNCRIVLSVKGNSLDAPGDQPYIIRMPNDAEEGDFFDISLYGNVNRPGLELRSNPFPGEHLITNILNPATNNFSFAVDGRMHNLGVWHVRMRVIRASHRPGKGERYLIWYPEAIDNRLDDARQEVKCHNNSDSAHPYVLALNIAPTVSSGEANTLCGQAYMFRGSGKLYPVVLRSVITGRGSLACVSDSGDVTIAKNGSPAGRLSTRIPFGDKSLYVWLIRDDLPYIDTYNDLPIGHYHDSWDDNGLAIRACFVAGSTVMHSVCAFYDGAGRKIATSYALNDFSNTAVNFDFVVESGQSPEGWVFRRYRSGYLEQWGEYKNMPDAWTITFPRPFNSTYYALFGEWKGMDSTANLGLTTQLATYAAGNRGPNGDYLWFACGFGA